MKSSIILLSLFSLLMSCSGNNTVSQTPTYTYRVTDTELTTFYNDLAEMGSAPQSGNPFYGQDAQYSSLLPNSYQDNGDGTVSDLVTGLMWQKAYIRIYYNDEADFDAKNTAWLSNVNNYSNLGGYSDWRIPSVKEQFSLALLYGDVTSDTPYIDTNYFDFDYPSTNNDVDVTPGQRKIDGQYVSSTKYIGVVNSSDTGYLAFNFADGHIKTYRFNGRTNETTGYFLRLVRGNTAYGINQFVDNGDGTVSDLATGLMWQQSDDGTGRNWQDALAYAEGLNLAGYTDWRLPDAKELQSIVDYSRNDPALDTSVFTMTDPTGWFWSSTTYLDATSFGIYICFGKAVNYLSTDTHGAGAMRGDPKSGDPSDVLYSTGWGPQNDDVRITNYVRAVRFID